MNESNDSTTVQSLYQLRQKGKFIKKSTLKYSRKRLANLHQYSAKRRELQDQVVIVEAEVAATQPKCLVQGRRIMEIGYVSEQMSCDACGLELSFSNIEAETKIGLASIFKIKCGNCSEVKTVYTSRKFPRDNDRSYEVNCKAATCSVASGINHRQLMKLLADVNIPFPSEASLRAAEKRKREEAAADQKKLKKNTQKKSKRSAPSTDEMRSPGNTTDVDEVLTEMTED